MGRHIRIITTIGAVVFCQASGAQQFQDAASLELGGVDFTPTLDVGLEYDSNVIQDDENIVESWSRVIAPQLNFNTIYGASDISVAYRVVDQTYFSSSGDDYTDHFLRASVDFEINVRNRFALNARYLDGHDARGASFSIGQGDNLVGVDRFEESQFDLSYSYGSFNADGRLEFDLMFLDKNYEIESDEYRVRNREETRAGVGFLYRLGPLTDLAVDYERTLVNYDFSINPLNPLDSIENSILLGLEWDATAKTSGFAKVGYQEKNFDSEDRDDFEGIDWSLGVTWEPFEYSQINIVTRADTNETNGEGNFIRTNYHSIEWNHTWLDRLRTSVSYRLANNRYEGQVVDGTAIRSDDESRVRFSTYYQSKRWLSFELSYTLDERDSNRNIIDFDRNRVLLSALVTL